MPRTWPLACCRMATEALLWVWEHSEFNRGIPSVTKFSCPHRFVFSDAVNVPNRPRAYAEDKTNRRQTSLLFLTIPPQRDMCHRAQCEECPNHMFVRCWLNCDFVCFDVRHVLPMTRLFSQVLKFVVSRHALFCNCLLCCYFQSPFHFHLYLNYQSTVPTHLFPRAFSNISLQTFIHRHSCLGGTHLLVRPACVVRHLV